MIGSAPVAPLGLLEDGLAFGELPFGVVACPEDVGKLAAVLLPIRDSVGGEGGVEPVQVADGGSTGVAQLVDPERQRVVRPDTGGDHIGPMMVKLVAQPGELVAPPALGRLEPFERVLVAAAVGRHGRPPRCRCCELRPRSPFRQPACLPGCDAGRDLAGLNPARRPRSASWRAVCSVMASIFDNHACARSALATAAASASLAVGRPAGEHPLMLVDQLAQLAVNGPGVAAGGQRWIGLAGQGVGDLFGAVALVGEDAAVVHDSRPGWCSRCGWAGGRGTGRCSPGRRPGRNCRAGGRSPRCRPGRRRRCEPRRATDWGVPSLRAPWTKLRSQHHCSSRYPG